MLGYQLTTIHASSIWGDAADTPKQKLARQSTITHPKNMADLCALQLRTHTEHNASV